MITKEHTIGFVGLGRMGMAMVERLHEAGWSVLAYDRNEAARKEAEMKGVKTAESIEAMCAALPARRVVWLMITSSAVDAVLAEVIPHLSAEDVVIDGGNSFYKDSLRRFEELTTKGLEFVDVGTSGGITGARHGASVMIGGTDPMFAFLEPLFKVLATEGGYAHVGGPGGGHFVKMVHNGIEYGMMGALAEGHALLEEQQSMLDLRIKEVLKPYSRESIIASKLMNWLRDAYETDQVSHIEGVVPRGETEHEMEHVVTLGDMPILSAALGQRRKTRDMSSRVGVLIAAMRNQFGGHAVVKGDDKK